MSADEWEQLAKAFQYAGMSEWRTAVDVVREKFDVTPKPEPPVILDEELGYLAMQAYPHETFTRRHVGERLRDALERKGLEIVRKEDAE